MLSGDARADATPADAVPSGKAIDISNDRARPTFAGHSHGLDAVRQGAATGTQESTEHQHERLGLVDHREVTRLRDGNDLKTPGTEERKTGADPRFRCPTRMLEVQHLTRRYGGLLAIQDLSFDVRPGEVLGLLGPNGSGKSTTVKIMTGLLQPTSGHIQLDRRDILSDVRAYKAGLGYVPEEPHLYS